MCKEKFTRLSKRRAEECIRTMDKRAQVFYDITEPLEVYEINERFYVRGCFEYDNLTLQELEDIFCGLYATVI